MFNVIRKNVLFEKWLHHLFEVGFPLRSVGFSLVLMLIPGVQVCKLMNSSYQKSILIQIVVDGDTMPFPVVRGPVIAKFTVSVARNFKFTFKVVYPPADERRSIRREIACKNFYFIQFFTSTQR